MHYIVFVCFYLFSYFFSFYSELSVFLPAHLGLVPILRLLHVLKGNCFILGPDVPQSSGEVWSDSVVHFHLQLLGLDTDLDFSNFLEVSWPNGKRKKLHSW